MLESITSTGWKATLDVRLEQRSERTVLAHLSHRGPLRIQRPFYPEGALCHLYFLHPPGGVVGGDNLSFDIQVAAEAQGLITAPGASKVYRSKGPFADISQRFQLSDNASLEWLPPGTIFFPGAKARLHSDYHLASSSRLIACETLCFGRPAMKETFDKGEVSASLDVTIDSQRVINEVIRIEEELDVLGPFAIHSTLLVYPADEALKERVDVLLDEYLAPAGATLIQGLMIIRLLATENVMLDKTIQRIWKIVRPVVLDLEPVAPRIWAT